MNMAVNDNITERDLVGRCLDGDKPAWDLLVTRYTGLVYHVMHRCAHKNGAALQPEELEDLHNDFFLCLLEDNSRRLRAFRGDAMLSTYLGRIVFNLTVDYLRRRRSQYSFDEFMVTDRTDNTGEASPLEQAISDDLIELVRRCMPQLPEKDRGIIDLRIFQRLSVNQIADELGLKVETARARIQRALEKLRKLVKKVH